MLPNNYDLSVKLAFRNYVNQSTTFSSFVGTYTAEQGRRGWIRTKIVCSIFGVIVPAFISFIPKNARNDRVAHLKIEKFIYFTFDDSIILVRAEKK